LKTLSNILLLPIGAMILAACATVPSGSQGYAGENSTHEAWRHLVAGDSLSATKLFAAKTNNVPRFDPFAHFGQALVSYEHGQTDPALEALLVLLKAGSAPAADAWTQWLATAGTSWMGTLVYETESWRARVDELISLLGPGLPWLARFELMQVADDTARRSGRLDVIARIADLAHCSTEAQVLGFAGHRPVLDLVAESSPRTNATRVVVSGCRAQVPPQSSLPGVLVVQSFVDAPTSGLFDIAIEYRGLAALRIDGGSWHYHGAPLSWGPSRSAVHTQLTKGKHSVELRLSTYSGGADYWLAAFDSKKTNVTDPPATLDEMPRSLVEPLAALSAVLVSRLAGHWNEGLVQAQRLLSIKSFALGLVEAGRLLESEPTRPDNVTRDKARTTWKSAVEVDPLAVRARLALSALENLEGRPREATASAVAAMVAAPKWWPATLAAHESLGTEGLEAEADRALNQALVLVRKNEHQQPSDAWACPVLEAAIRRARLREQLSTLDGLLHHMSGCEARDSGWAARLSERGHAAQAALAYQAIAKLSSASQWTVPDQSSALAAAGDAEGAVVLMEAQTKVWPKEPAFVVRLANLQVQAGKAKAARATVEQALRKFPAAADVRQLARAMNVPMPGDADRTDGLKVIAAYLKSGHTHDAPAVFVLDRLVERVFLDGSRTLLTHSIVKVQSKEALDRWGEVNVPAGSEVLNLRTIKPDLSVREPEDIFGKETVSAPELEVGDFVEWETLESIEPSAAFGGGFVSQRFYFQSNEAPMERSEYVIVSPRQMPIDFDARGGAPHAVEQSEDDGTIQRRFVSEGVPQVFPERAAVAALHWIPSVRISSGVDTHKWSDFVADRLSAVARRNPAVEFVAKTVLEEAGGANASARARAEALVAWVTSNIEPEGSADEAASFAIARGKGNRLAVALALSALLDVKAELVLARPLSVAASDEPSSPQESMSFSDVLLRFPGLNIKPSSKQAPDVFADLRLRYAPFGYIAPGLDGANAIRLNDGSPIRIASSVMDVRQVRLDIAVDAKGDASISAQEHLVGAAALDWSEALLQLGADDDKRRHRFEEAYLSYHFPGATLKSLAFKPGAGQMDLEYQLSVERFATPTADGLSLEPRFFLAQPGRRYANEASRKTTLLMGPEAPLDVQATITWPKGAKVLDIGKSVVVHPLGIEGPLFEEDRHLDRRQPATVLLHRRNSVPVVRVVPSDYLNVSAALRRVDAAEQAAIQIRFQEGAQ
jgi:cellulose synthase operon protein C